MADSISDCVQTAPDLGDRVRARLGLAPRAPLRVSYLPGPGDVAGTFRYWQAGRHDPRVPIVAYSLMFYELMRRIGAEMQVITAPEIPEDLSRLAFIRFEQAKRLPAEGRRAIRERERSYGRELAARVDSFAPHVVLASTDVPSSAWNALKASDRVLLLSAHNSFWPMGQPPRGLKAQVKMALLMRQARALDGAIATSHECARQLAAITRGRVQASAECPQIIGSFDIRPRETARNLLFLGRIEENKGIFDLLAAFEALMEAQPDLTLIFAGSGSAQGTLTEAIARLGNPRTRYLGQLDSSGVHDAIAASDLLVCPTTSGFNEGLAVVGFEAAAHGVPSVMSSVVPAIELLGNSCASYPADDATALAETLGRLASDPVAYSELCAATAPVRDMTRNRALSWGTLLGEELART